jgi:hypothetical protein
MTILTTEKDDKNDIKIAKIYKPRGPKIKGKSDNEEFIYVNQDKQPPMKIDDLSEEYIHEFCGDIISYEAKRVVKPEDQKKIVNCIIGEERPKDLRLGKIYDQCMAVIETAKGKEIITNDDVQPVPIKVENQVDIVYIAGAAGSGKSTYIFKWLCEYLEEYPKNKIFFISRKEEDEALKKIDKYIERIILDGTFLETFSFGGEESVDPLEYFKDSVCVFDDVDTIVDKDIHQAVIKLRNDLLQTGRSQNISMICSSHVIMDRDNTKLLLTEASSIVVFPKSGNVMQIEALLKRYYGWNRFQINKFKNLPSRWAALYCRAPQYVVYEHGIYLV